MTGNQAVLIHGDDWSGLFINGVLVDEGHSISGYSLLESVVEHAPVTSFWVGYCDLDWLADLGEFPDELSKVKLTNPPPSYVKF